jgi:hypothetical protein
LNGLSEASPRLTVVVAATDSADAVARCIADLQSDSTELVVAADPGRVARPSNSPARAIWIEAEPGALAPRLRRLGLDRASAPVVAFTEDSCRLDPGWADAWVGAFEDASLVAATGHVRLADRAGRLDRAVFLCEYAPFLPRAGSSEPRVPLRLAGNNFAARREWISGVTLGDVHEGEIRAAAGAAVLNAPNASAIHVRSYTIREAFGDRAAFGREYGSRRSRGASGTHRVLGLVSGPAVFVIQLVRLIAILGIKHRLKAFAGDLPLTALLLAAWSVGEWLGWVEGAAEVAKSRIFRRRRETAARIDGRATHRDASPPRRCKSDQASV